MAIRFRAVALVALAVLVSSACHGGDQEPEARYPPARKKEAAKDPARVRALDSVRLVDVPAGTFGPYVADTPTGALVAWAAQTEGNRAWWSLRIDAKGNPVAKPIQLAAAPSEVGLAVVEPKKLNDASGGFVLLYTRRVDKKTSVEALSLGPNGTFQGGPRSIAEVDGDVIWIDVVPTASGTLVFWGVRRDTGADLFTSSLESGSKGGREVIHGARAWQAASMGDVVMLGTLSDKKIEVTGIDTSANPGRRIVVAESATAEADLDLVASGDGLLLAWSDRKDLDVRVFVAAVDAQGKVIHPPAPAVTGLGEQALVRLVAPYEGRGPAYLAWENLQERPLQGRTIQLATLAADGTVADSRVELRHAASESTPELTATASGLGALTLASACKKGGECSIAPLVPTFVELDRSLEVKGSEPVRLTVLGGEAPDLAWGLSCVRAPCSMLAAQASDPAPVYAVKLRSGKNDYIPAASRLQRNPPPRAATLETIGAGDPMADVAIAKVGTTTLAAWVTYFDPTAPAERPKKAAPDGKFEAVRALLQVRSLTETNRPAAETLSLRARSLGGVALAPGVGQNDALVGWTALDNKLPQVFVTLIDGAGKKVRQKMLTRAPGEKTDVALAGIGDGWLSAWVDERGGDPEVYAVKVNRLMQSAGPEHRISNAAGAASGVALLAIGDRAILVWSDARDAVRPGWADLYATTLKGVDATPLAAEQPIAKTPLHSHSPVLAPFGKGALLAWIEAAPKDAGGSGDAEVAVVALDEAAHPIGSSTRIKALNGAPTAVSVDCASERCRIAFSVGAGDHAELESVTWAGGKVSTPVRLVALTGPAGTSVAPALLGRELVFADKSLEQGRVRRLLIDWE